MPTKQYAARVTIGGALHSSFKSAFGGASDAIKNLGKEVRTLAKQRADIKAFGDSKAKIDQLRQKLDEAKVSAKNAADALANAAKPTAKLTRESDAAARKVAALEKQIEGQVGSLGALTLKLNQAGMKTADLARHDARLEARIKSVTKAIRGQEAAQARLGAARGKLGSWMGAGMAVGGAVAAMAPAVVSAAKFSDAMVDVGKFVDDTDTPEKLAQIGETIREIGRNSPLGATGIASIVADAGKIGMLSKDALAFAQATGVMAIGLEMTAEEAGEMITKIKTGMGTSIKETLELGDAMNFLADKTAASSKGIADIVMRQGGTVKATTKLTTEQIAALAAAFEPVAPNTETAATAMKNFTKALTIGTAASDAQQAAFKKIGMTSKGVSEAMQKDGVGTIMKVLEAVKKVPDAERGAVLTKLFGDESKGAIAQLLNNTQQVADAFGFVADKQRYLGRSQAEYEREMGKFSNQWALMKNQIADIGITIGDALLPAVRSMFGVIGKVTKSISAWSKENPKLFKGLVIGTAAIIGITAAVVGVGIAVHAAGVAFAALGVVAAKIGVAIAAVGAGPIAIAVAAIGAAALAIRKYWEPLSAFFKGVWMGIVEGWNEAGGAELWNKITDLFGRARDALGEFLEPVKLTPGEMKILMDWGKKLGVFIGEGLVAYIELGIRAWDGFFDVIQSVKNVFTESFNAMKEVAERFFGMLDERIPAVGKGLEKLKGFFGMGVSNEDLSNGQRVIQGPPKGFIPPPLKGAGPTSNNTIHINTQPGQSAESIADTVLRRLRSIQDQDARGSLFDSPDSAYG